MLLSAHTPKRADGNAALNAAEWLSLAAAADGSVAKPSRRMASPGDQIAGRVADWLSLAAAPTFAIMAVLTATTGSADMICMTTPDAFPIGGMLPMYLLMSGFHLAPWLRLAAGWRGLSR
ncbi:hypothetical protein [Rhizobium leguminosarum]|jgi:hypothetical protein|uniref:Transmembrane protein n=1 Tax=Rhizobium leguminosarum bv. trifolii (strain WSM1325) TaxID=395491 RepID=C6B3Y6_RHILS|nr:hypothetical protein [Rhizobium leguminosarum]ACS56937.1 conserved hypothetical protein [Rhizobium leguminosarum bv. trifolii WSM1325]MBY2912060.1 hypothetical protein [Rhizobium leguminosarum]MBY2925907.1 hypothetical protein [Rhizobium leguminosarum]MBY2936466.1 hypothetical protein [Rhizobium leguminosarum]MBY2951994.1 hypothetical protein [Rhizobium leguminosarum]